jgi:hypothetical protein
MDEIPFWKVKNLGSVYSILLSHVLPKDGDCIIS